MTPHTGYLSAEVCARGHFTTDQLEYEPERAAKFCPQCGAETIRACQRCNASIRGAYERTGTVFGYGRTGTVFNVSVPPNHCHNCGAVFPWTAAKIAAAKEHAGEIEGLDEAERAKLQEAIEDLATGGPRTELGASRFKRLMEKVGKPAASGLYKLVLDVATEAAKKAITQQLPW